MERQATERSLSHRIGLGIRQAVVLLTAPFRALLRLVDPPAGPAVRRPLLPPRAPSGNREAARVAAGQGLGSLSRLLGDRDPERRKLALETIGELDGERSATLVNELLNDPDPGVRASAAIAAARTRAPAVVFSLILCLEDGEPEVRLQAKKAIEAIIGEPVTLDTDAPFEARQTQIDQLKQRWKQRRLEQLTEQLAREAR